jgi:hypothetical protein
MSQKIMDTSPASSATKFSALPTSTRYFKVVDSVEDELRHQQSQFLVADVDFGLEPFLRDEVEFDQAVVAVLQDDLQQQVCQIPNHGPIEEQRRASQVEDPFARQDGPTMLQPTLTGGW